MSETGFSSPEAAERNGQSRALPRTVASGGILIVARVMQAAAQLLERAARALLRGGAGVRW